MFPRTRSLERVVERTRDDEGEEGGVRLLRKEFGGWRLEGEGGDETDEYVRESRLSGYKPLSVTFNPNREGGELVEVGRIGPKGLSSGNFVKLCQSDFVL